MSTDAFFFFHMDRDMQSTPPAAPAAILSTSSSSIVSSHARKQFLVEYSPKPAVVPAHPYVARQQQQQQQQVQQQSSAHTQTQAIHRWLATHRSYEPIEHSSFSSDEESEAQEACDESESESEDDQIYMAPRRQHSAPSISITAAAHVPQPLPTIANAVPRRAWPLSAARPALPVVDRAEATAFTTVLLEDKEKSYWSDDEDDEEEEQEQEEWLAEDEEDDDLDLPALEEDSGAPASTSTRSLPIPIRTHSNPILRPAVADADNVSESDCVQEHDLDALWNSSPPSHQRRPSRKVIQHGQSFWAPWIKDYMATQKLVQ